ncbi:MAG: GNAT family N-acetyltransferase [Lachnospiraceae bacterium]|nr:GNAT family N-acetyltransferase [Lachnospiraceae bacterium]
MERILKKVVVYIEEPDETLKRQTGEMAEGLRREGLCVELPEVLGNASGQKAEMSEERAGVVLYLTDKADFAISLAENGLPVLGLLHDRNRQESFGGVQFLIEGAEDITADYLERVYRRCVGLPWEIMETKSCILRETTEEDLDAFYRIYAEPSITRYMENLFEDREKERAYIAQYREKIYGFYGFGIWTVLLKETEEIIGRAGLDMRAGFEEPELGFLIGVPWQGRGFAQEICEAILFYAKAALEFTQVQAMVEPENDVSLMLLDKLGFTPVGEYVQRDITYLRLLREL